MMSRSKNAWWLAVACTGATAAALAIATTREDPDGIGFGAELCEQIPNARPHVRTELIFGMARNGGADVQESEFQRFVETNVMPRFPEGLTVVTGDGRFKSASGEVVRETSKLLVLLYPRSHARSEQIEAIRRDYREAFNQQSVLRIEAIQCVAL